MDSTEPATATVTRGGKIHLPARVLRNLNVKEGGQVVFYLKPGRALLVPSSAAFTKQQGW